MERVKFCIKQPLLTGTFFEHPDGQRFPLYSNGDDDELRWAGTIRLPQIGDYVDVRTNHLGASVVTGYWMAWGYLGVMVKPRKLPEDITSGLPKNSPQWMLEGIVAVDAADIELTAAGGVRQWLRKVLS